MEKLRLAVELAIPKRGFVIHPRFKQVALTGCL